MVVGILSVSSATFVWAEVWECEPDRVLTEFNPFDVVAMEEETSVVVEMLAAFVGVDPVLTSSLVSGWLKVVDTGILLVWAVDAGNVKDDVWSVMSTEGDEVVHDVIITVPDVSKFAMV